jgi:pimeloyl-ACP methyl ester carboxylesterase
VAVRGSAHDGAGANAGASLDEQRRLRAEAAFATLPDRFLGAEPGFGAVYEIRLGDVGRTWQVRVDGDRCEVRPTPSGDPDVVIGTDAGTWLALREGRLSGVDAFASGRLYARGDLDLALGFEGLFRLPGDRPPLLRATRVATKPAIASLIAGGGPEQVVCLHGLGANKASFFETISALTPEHTVHTIDLPGFGTSDKPARGPYDAAWFARCVISYLDATAIDRAHLVGNSMGGRVALEVALSRPDRVASLSLLCPAVAFRRKRELAPLVRLLRPELAAIPHPMRAAQVRETFWSLFARPERLDPATADLVADQFCETYRTRSARVAFYAAARNIYLDAPHGEDGFWTRLARLEPEAMFLWGDHDRLIPAGFARHVAEALPGARQEVLADCGHVPQVELPDRTNSMIADHIAATAAPMPADRPRQSRRSPRARARGLLGKVAALGTR